MLRSWARLIPLCDYARLTGWVGTVLQRYGRAGQTRSANSYLAEIKKLSGGTRRRLCDRGRRPDTFGSLVGIGRRGIASARSYRSLRCRLCCRTPSTSSVAAAGGERWLPRLAALDGAGRLGVLGSEATADPHLRCGAPDHWFRVACHLIVKSVSPPFVFPGNHLLLVALLVEFHPTTKGSRAISTEPLKSNESGLAVEWRKGPEVMFRPPGAERPH